jgi:hypothetical protein
MAHFAQLNQNNVVIQVIVIGNADCLDDNGSESETVGIAFCQSLHGVDTQWRQTSYNAKIRKNYAGIGYVYDVQRDAFISPKPYPSFILNEETCQWTAPVSRPNDDAPYQWDEDSGTWIEIAVAEQF